MYIAFPLLRKLFVNNQCSKNLSLQRFLTDAVIFIYCLLYFVFLYYLIIKNKFIPFRLPIWWRCFAADVCVFSQIIHRRWWRLHVGRRCPYLWLRIRFQASKNLSLRLLHCSRLTLNKPGYTLGYILDAWYIRSIVLINLCLPAVKINEFQ